MKINVGGTDRILRVVLGLALIGMAAFGVIGAWGWIGVIALITGLIGWCPLYAMFGIDTRKPLKQADGKPPAHPSA